MMARGGKNKKIGGDLVIRHKELGGLENRTFAKRSEELRWFGMQMRGFRGVTKRL